jgi:hypothetical protein
MSSICAACPRRLEFLCPGDDLRTLEQESAVADAAFIIAGTGFFVLSALYALICERL